MDGGEQLHENYGVDATLPEQLAGSCNAQEDSGIASVVHIDAPGCRKGYKYVRHTT